MRYVLFVCTHNAGRSQMAAAFFERHSSEDLRAESAGQGPVDAISNRSTTTSDQSRSTCRDGQPANSFAACINGT